RARVEMQNPPYVHGAAANPERRAAAVRFAYRSLGLAAAILLLVLGALSAWFLTQRGTYVTDVGEQRSFMLEDGSSVELNSRSRLKVHFTGCERSIELQAGQALFRVANDRTRPFVVNSGNASVRAVGTQFDVYRKKSGTVVTVLEGIVAIASRKVEQM